MQQVTMTLRIELNGSRFAGVLATVASDARRQKRSFGESAGWSEQAHEAFILSLNQWIACELRALQEVDESADDGENGAGAQGTQKMSS
jgi:hypothetical protein